MPSKLSTTLRWTTNGLSLLSVFCFSGIIFGWAPLELMLLEEGQYHELCDTSNSTTTDSSSTTTTTTTTTDPTATATTTCAEQMNHLNAMFTLAQFFLSFASLPVGFLLDIAPKPIHFGIAGILEIIGLLFMSISDSQTSDYFVLGYSFLALGGCMTMLGSFPASFLLPQHQAGILASISCLFDGSSIIFYIFYRLNTSHGGYTRKQLFQFWSIVAVIMYTSLVICWIYLERLDWKNIIDQEESEEFTKEESQEFIMSTTTTSNNNNGNHKETTTDKVDDDDDDLPHHHDPHFHRVYKLGLHALRVTRQLQTWEFMLGVLFASCQMLRCNFFIMTVDDYLDGIGDDDDTFANLFSWILPLGIVFVPIIEWTVTKCGVIQTLHITNGIGLLFGLLLFVPNLIVQAINFCIFTGFRAFLYATLNTFIAVTFGVATMGRIIGSVFTTAAIVSLIQYPLSVWTNSQLDGDFIPANIILVLLCIVPIIATVWYERSSSATTTSYDDQSDNDNLIDATTKKGSYASVPTGRESSPKPKRTSLLDGRNSALLASPGSPSLSALRRIRLEVDATDGNPTSPRLT